MSKSTRSWYLDLAKANGHFATVLVRDGRSPKDAAKWAREAARAYRIATGRGAQKVTR